MQNPTTEMKAYDSHYVPKGCWSDDSSMILGTIDAIYIKKQAHEKIDFYANMC